MPKFRTLLFYCLSGLYLSTASAETIYRWVDAKGAVHFSQSPPSSGQYQRLNPELPPPTSAPALQGLKQLSQQYQSQQAQAAKQHEAEIRNKAEKAEACAKARQRVSQLQSATAHRLFVKTAGGKRTRMTEPQFNKLLDAAKAQVDANCSS